MGTGNTQLVCTREEFEAVHPRGHGEHPKNKRRKNGSNGSSPWARGTLTNSLNPRTASRFIPVGTGNTYSGATFDATSTVHPRGHGEHSTPFTSTITSPRFIPVGTGNTPFYNPVHSLTSVHPRGHGEHIGVMSDPTGEDGSSPWARGTHDGTLDAALVNRFIPVGTGNTASGRQTGRKTTVHPRGHGEHARLLHHGISCGGSSPWARGTQGQNATVPSLARFIPVGTGNTCDTLTVHTQYAVHPRGHGEHFSLWCCCECIDGSSPWARGTLDYDVSYARHERFIPVGTGNTYRSHVT